ncbi:MAG: hypothetical protein PVI21_04520 [Candidatus Woesebacteria bacterium]|jgi:hypothetical protein
MEPRLPTPHLSPEAGAYNPETPKGQERGTQLNKIETVGSAEKSTNQEARELDPSQAMSVALPSAQAMSPIGSGSSASSKRSPKNNLKDVPVSASEDDVIEKEWVNKAKQIVKNTKNDPYMQGLEVSKLQADYLKKRHGIDVKVSGG